MDREDAFYLYENGHLFRQHGYYIYYDRNEDMQNYMIEIRQENHIEEHGTPGFQNRLSEKKNDHRIKREALVRKKKRNMKWIPQAAVLLLILAVVGIKRNLPGAVVPTGRQMIGNGETESTAGAAETSEHLDLVESIVQQAEQSVSGKESQESVDKADTEEDTAERGQENDTEQKGEQQETSAEETEVMVGAYKSYIVKEGDTLLKISRNYYQDAAHVEEIRQLNQIEDPDYIYPGMVLRLP